MNLTNEESDEKEDKKNEEINEALKACGFGRFHVKLMLGTFFAFMNGSMISNTVPYILPNAECDLNMNLVQKGVLNGAAFVGMCISTILAGFLTDAFGRRIFLVAGFGGITFFTIFSGISQSFEMLVSGKFFEGLTFAAAFSPTMTYSSEFCHNGIRDRVMMLQSSCLAIALVILALISWAILPQDWTVSFFGGSFVLYTWNFYLLLSAVWPLIAFIFYYFLPESPKYLLAQRKYEEARAVLINMYVANTGKPAETYPYSDLWKNEQTKVSNEKLSTSTAFTQTLKNGLRNCKPMFKRPLGLNMVLLCIMNFIAMIPYNVTRLWFPQISTIVEHYSKNTYDFCGMLEQYTVDQKLKIVEEFDSVSDICIPVKSGTETYINSIITGGASVLPYILNGLLVNKVGKKILLLVSGVITIACSLWLRWATSKVEVVALFAIDMALGQTMMGLLAAVTVEVFPTTTRTLAIAMIMMSGRIGTLVGNITFPILLDISCAGPFFSLAALLTCVTIMYLFLPKKSEA